MKAGLTLRWVPLTTILGLVLACGDGAGVAGAGGSSGAGGADSVSPCEASVCPCTEEGLRGALEEGGGPFTFSCDGASVIATSAELIVRRDVILDGEGMLTVDARDTHRVLSVFEGASAELRSLVITGGNATIADARGERGGGIFNVGTLLLRDVLITDCAATVGSGIYSEAALMVEQSTIARNRDGGFSGGVHIAGGTATITNSTIAENTVNGVYARCSTVRMSHTTLAGNSDADIQFDSGCRPDAELEANIVAGRCGGGLDRLQSNGYNIESPADTCGFRRAADLNDVEPGRLDLQPIGPTDGGSLTMALGTESIAIDRIGLSACRATVDQRGLERPQGDACDVGAYEVEVP